ncbi:MAG: hypothetical protein JEY71_04835 [Sphaerochaeta sp.]|nr:hypothetical protein [Sphaerochaeta sp.]
MEKISKTIEKINLTLKKYKEVIDLLLTLAIIILTIFIGSIANNLSNNTLEIQKIINSPLFDISFEKTDIIDNGFNKTYNTQYIADDNESHIISNIGGNIREATISDMHILVIVIQKNHEPFKSFNAVIDKYFERISPRSTYHGELKIYEGFYNLYRLYIFERDAQERFKNEFDLEIYMYPRHFYKISYITTWGDKDIKYYEASESEGTIELTSDEGKTVFVNSDSWCLENHCDLSSAYNPELLNEIIDKL